MHRFHVRWVAAVVAAAVVLVPSPAIAAPGGTANGGSTGVAKSEKVRSDVDPAVRDRVLGSGWSASDDIAWTTSGDASGFHVLAATAKTGYAWRAIASLSEPGFDVDQWIGNACVAGSGRTVAVVYAPRTFTNKAALRDRGGFTALVDLTTGAVTKLPFLSSLAYFNPGCGTGSTVVFSAFHEDKGTRLVEVDTAAGSPSAPITVQGQITSVVPVSGKLIGAANRQLVRIERSGALTGLTPTTGVAYGLTPDSTGGLVYLEHNGEQARVRRTPAVDRREATTLAEGALTEVGVTSSATGKVFITGKAQLTRALPSGVVKADVPKGATVSTRGELALSRVGFENPKLLASDPSAPRSVRVTAKALGTGTEIAFGASAVVAPSQTAASGRQMSPKLGVGGGTLAPSGRSMSMSLQTLGDPTEPWEDERYCSVPRNDPRNQALQPRPRQVEWAVDQAITGTPYAARPANWMNLGLPAYSPLEEFPRIPLVGGGRVPAQVYLGILAQESNLWQAARFAVPGVTANPLIGNFYGLQIYNQSEADDWDIRWDHADCGYGVGQVTDGMRAPGHARDGEVLLPADQQRMIALDYAANIAAGVRILQSKWNETRNAGLIINDGDPANIENWFYAIWAYNSGFHPESEASQNSGAWGVGWGNNPANPNYDPSRLPFLWAGYDDARNPQFWPYAEKVIGFAAYPPELPDDADTTVAAYRAAWWGGSTAELNRQHAKPPIDTFCDTTNQCDYDGTWHTPNDPDVIGEPAGPCNHLNGAGQYDLKCWYHYPKSWKSCVDDCGYELLRFDPYWPEQPDATSYEPACDTTTMNIPANAFIVDDIPNSDAQGPLHSVRPNCDRPNSYGSFTLDFASDSAGLHPSKVDFHQLGAGFGGHFWFAHTRQPGWEGGKMKVTGTWSLEQPLNQWVRFLVHLPDLGAHTRQASYQLDLGSGSFDKTRVIPQRTRTNGWVSLGALPVNGVPRIRLSTDALDGTGEEDIAWDAVAFEPLAAAPEHRIVALGDSYSSGEGATSDFTGSDYYNETDFKLMTFDPDEGEMVAKYQNLCHRSTKAWSRKVTLTDDPRTVGTRADVWDPDMDFHLIACSGARTKNVLPHHTVPSGQTVPVDGFGNPGEPSGWGELPQLDQGFVDEYTTLVTISIGGNDAEFSKILAECATYMWGYCYEMTIDGDSQPLSTAEPARIDGPVRDGIAAVLAAIHQKAPNAKILLMGYPHIMEPQGWCSAFGSANIAWFDEMTDRLATAMDGAVDDALGDPSMAGAQIVFADPRPSFAGHGACADQEAINGTVLTRSKGELSSLLPSQQSYHPNPYGTDLYAGVLRQALDLAGWGI